MNIKPIASPHAMNPQTSNATDSRSRAIAAFNSAGQAPAPAAQPQAQQSPVQNPSQVSPEEMTAIRPPTGQVDTIVEAIAEDTQDAPAAEEAATPAKPVEDPALSRQFAQLARQEKALRQKQMQQDQAFKAREAALAAKEAELASKGQQDLSQYIPRERIKQDVLGVLAEAGINYDDVTQQILTQQPRDPRMDATISELKAEIKALKQANEDTRNSYTEQQKQAYAAAVKQIESDARSLVKSDASFEAIRATNSIKDVVELITQTYDKDGILLSVEEAAQQVEDYLVEEATKIAKLNKIQERLKASAKPAAPPAAQKPANSPQQPQMKTLTNAASAPRQMSARERAIAAFKGELK